MKKTLLYVLLSLFVFASFIVAKVPAKHILYRVSLPPAIQLYDVTGTLWSGQAGLVIAQGQPLENVRWDLSAISLLFGTAEIDVLVGNQRVSDAIYIDGKIQYGLFSQTTEITKTVVKIPAETMLASANLPIPVLAKGHFNITVGSAAFGGAPKFTCTNLDASGKWQNAGVLGQSGLIELGEFLADVDCANNRYTLRVTEPNDLGLSFTASGANIAQLSVTGKFKLPADAPQDLVQVAQFFGQANSSGYTSFKF